MYGQPLTRTSRTIWCLREIRVDFKVEQKKLFTGIKDLNPNNKQPVIIDVDGTIVV